MRQATTKQTKTDWRLQEAVKSAERGDFAVARTMLDKAAHDVPDDASIRDLRLAFAPGEPLAKTPAEAFVAANARWLRANAGSYRGKWIALDSGVLIGCAASLAELRRQITVRPSTFVTKLA